MAPYYLGIFLLLTTCTCSALASSSSLPATAGSQTSLKSASSTSSGDAETNDEASDLFDWARQHGTYISEAVEIREKPYRGIYATTDLPANTELIRVPYKLQLSVRHLSKHDDEVNEELQELARSLPWQYILQQDLAFIPLAVALCAEKRKGASSLFWPYLQQLPDGCTNAVMGSDDDIVLQQWAPITAQKLRMRTLGLLNIHGQLAPDSLSMETLKWAASMICSRSLVRSRIKEISPEHVERIGVFCAADHARLLPVIDLVNHGSGSQANAWVGHLPTSEHQNKDDPDDTFTTSLKTTRDVRAGEELLFDYGGNGQVTNERLLLDFGFCLPDHPQSISLTLEEFVPAISALSEHRKGMKDVSPAKKEEAGKLIQALASALGGPPPLLLFEDNGEPTVPTLALALSMTCTGADDVERLLVTEVVPSDELPQHVVAGCSEAQKDFALLALRTAAAMALANRPPIPEDESSAGPTDLTGMAGIYAGLCRDGLQRIADSK